MHMELNAHQTLKVNGQYVLIVGATLLAVLPVENVKYWRHKGGDSDTWSEPEGERHLWWKERFDLECREIGLIDKDHGERHRADILCGARTPLATVLELQHSNISEEERLSREKFYSRDYRMFWLVHIHSETSFNEFRIALYNLNRMEFINAVHGQKTSIES